MRKTTGTRHMQIPTISTSSDPYEEFEGSSCEEEKIHPHGAACAAPHAPRHRSRPLILVLQPEGSILEHICRQKRKPLEGKSGLRISLLEVSPVGIRCVVIPRSLRIEQLFRGFQSTSNFSLRARTASESSCTAV